MNRHATRITAAMAALLSLGSFPCQAGDGAEQVFKKVSPSIVTVLAFDEKNRQEGQGSGIVIGVGRIATNCHVVREALSLKAVSGETQYAASWILTDPKRDLCLLKVEALAAPAVSVRKLGDIPVGESVFAVGNPLGFGLSVSAGLISRIVLFQGEQVIVSSAPQSPGSSGGGLFDSEGRLLGITSGMLGTGQNLNLVLPAEWIAALGTRGVAPPPPVIVPAPEPHWIDEAQALQRSSDWTRLEKHAREWQAGQPTAALAAAYLGAAMIAQGRHKEGEAALREALRLDDSNEFAWLQLAATLHSQGRKSEAEAALRRSEALLPNHGATHHLRGEWLRAEQRFQEAAAEMYEAIRLEPGVSGHWRDLGRLEDQLGHAEEAAKAYRTALRLTPSDEKLKQALARVLARQGKLEDAHLTLSQKGDVGLSEADTWLAMGYGELQRKRYGVAENAYRKATEIAPELPQAWAGLGTALANTNRAAEAEKAFDRALALKSAPSEFVAETLVNRATVRNTLGNKSAALADAQRAVEINANFAAAYRLLGILMMENRDNKNAVVAYRQVVALGDAGADDWVSLGECLERLGDKKSALEALEKAEKLDAQNKRVLQAMAGFHGRNGDLQRALAYIDRALALDSSDPHNWSSKGYALLKLGRMQESASALKTAVSLDPQFANAWINLGEAQLRSRDLGQAIQSLEKALTLTPAALDARFYLAQSYLSTRQSKKAREQAEIVLQRQPNLPQALGVVTLSYLMEGKGEAASDSYRRLHAKNPAAARSVRTQAIAQGLAGAQGLPE